MSNKAKKPKVYVLSPLFALFVLAVIFALYGLVRVIILLAGGG